MVWLCFVFYKDDLLSVTGLENRNASSFNENSSTPDDDISQVELRYMAYSTMYFDFDRAHAKWL